MRVGPSQQSHRLPVSDNVLWLSRHVLRFTSSPDSESQQPHHLQQGLDLSCGITLPLVEADLGFSVFCISPEPSSVWIC